MLPCPYIHYILPASPSEGSILPCPYIRYILPAPPSEGSILPCPYIHYILPASPSEGSILPCPYIHYILPASPSEGSMLLVTKTSDDTRMYMYVYGHHIEQSMDQPGKVANRFFANLVFCLSGVFTLEILRYLPRRRRDRSRFRCL